MFSSNSSVHVRQFALGLSGRVYLRYRLWSYEYMKILCVNCGVKNYMKEDHRSYICNFCSCEMKAWKKFEPLTSAIIVQCSSNWANKPAGSRSLNWFVINLWKDGDEVMNIWKSYIWTAGWRTIWRKIIAYATFVRIPYNPEYFSGFHFATAKVAYIITVPSV